MKQFGCIWFAGLVMVAGPALACSPGELTQKQKAYGDAVKIAFDRDPGGDDARRAKAMAVIDRYSGLKPGLLRRHHHRHAVQGKRRAPHMIYKWDNVASCSAVARMERLV